jgi:hypothetical protein
MGQENRGKSEEIARNVFDIPDGFVVISHLSLIKNMGL